MKRQPIQLEFVRALDGLCWGHRGHALTREMLEEAFRAVAQTCPSCGGMGQWHGADWTLYVCGVCGGSGRVPEENK